jgi:hypothetical protein
LTHKYGLCACEFQISFTLRHQPIVDYQFLSETFPPPTHLQNVRYQCPAARGSGARGGEYHEIN